MYVFKIYLIRGVLLSLFLILISACSSNTPKPSKTKGLVLELDEQSKNNSAVHVGKLDFYVK